MPHRRKMRNPFWTIALGGVVAIGVMTLTFGRMSADFDRIVQKREERLAANGLNARLAEVSQQVLPQVVWDDAVRNLDNRFDEDWARDNIGLYLEATDGFGFSYILDHSDRPVFGMEGTRPVSAQRFEAIAPVASAVVSRVRRGESSRNPLRGIGPGNALMAGSFEQIDGRLLIVSANLVQPDFGAFHISHSRAPIVVTGREIDGAFVNGFAQRYLMKDAHLHPGDATSEKGQAHAAIRDSRGRIVATLDWTPQQPGQSLFRTFAPLTLLLSIALLGGLLLLQVKARKAALAVEVSEAHALHMAYHDQLTGLGNRRAIAEAVGKLDGADSVGLVVHRLNLDAFKILNDLHSHAAGDELLVQLARRLSDIAGEDRCFRLGGDEFAVLHAALEDEPAIFAQRLSDAVGTPFDLTIGSFPISCCVGSAPTMAGETDGIDALRRADLALVAAKREGRDRISAYAPGMDEDLRRRRGLQEALRRDLLAGRLGMVYQPQVDRDHQMIGLEALVRWTSEEFGPVSPAVFVPLAEEAGLIEALGAFTLRQAFLDSRRWPKLKVAVNISALELVSPGFASRVVSVANDTGVRPQDIELELTEGVLAESGSASGEALAALKAAGFSIAIDDFGTGYSSLSYLSRFPVGKIKIDRSFVKDLGHSKSADALVATIVQMGRSLQMRVIAEGVETPEQWLRLAAAGCCEFQGYLASRPVSAEVVDRLYAGSTSEVVGQDARYAPEYRAA